MKPIHIIRLLIAAAAVCGIAYIACTWHSTPAPDNIQLQRATARKVEDVVKLCSMEIYDEVPVKGSIGTRHLFGRMLLKASVNFDIANLHIDTSADTIRVTLPPEEVEVLESTDDNAYIIIDTWNTRFLGSTTFTADEENSIKAKVRHNWLRGIYRNGTVARARAEAVGNLTHMLSATLHRPVIVTDPTPHGAHFPAR